MSATVAARPFSKIPGPRCWPFIGNWLDFKLGKYGVEKYHEVVQDLYKKFGRIVHYRMGRRSVIHVFHPEDFRIIYQREGKTPFIIPLQETIQKYRRMRQLSPGLGNTNGEEWYRLRSAVHQMMLRPKEVSYYLPLVEEVASDFVERLRLRRDKNGLIDNLLTEISKWSIESGAMVCLETRLGSFSGGDGETQADAMIEANQQVFYLSGHLKLSLGLHQWIPTPKWRRLVKAEDCFYSYASEIVKSSIQKLQRLQETNQLQEGQYNFLSYLLSRSDLSMTDVFIISLSLFGDSLSTTSPTLLRNLYALAINPEVQNKLYEEIKNMVPLGQVFTSSALGKMPYLKACVKETFRLYPSGTEIARINQEDLILSGYHIPAGTHLNLNHFVHFRSEEYFRNAEVFDPDRWLRGVANKEIDPHILQPFGFGSRMCAGRRFAEQDLYVLITKILQQFELKYLGDEGPLEQVYHTLLFPAHPLKIAFIERNMKK